MTMRLPVLRDHLSQRVRDFLEPRQNVRELRMFGGVSFMVDDRMAVAASGDGDLLVRTNPANYDALLERGAVPALMGKDKQMGRGWMSVPRELLDEPEELAFWVTVGIESRNAVT